MKLLHLSIVAAATCVLATSAHALKTEDRVLKGDYTVEYTKTPGSVNSLSEMITEGDVYGRLRSNAFWWDWETERASNSHMDNNSWGLGGSVIYKTGIFHGFSSTLGFYGTVPVGSEDILENGTKTGVKSGKDTFRSGSDGSANAIGVLAEATLEYKLGKTQVVAGRQKIESMLMSSNDTKMVPQTFEAVTLKNKDISDTMIHAGYITKQKLRDHQEFHSIIAVKNGTNVLDYNDDYGRHQGFTVENINGAGEEVEPGMLFLTAENKSAKDLKLNAGYFGIDGYLQDIIAEANYKIGLGDGWTLTPGVRYFHQMDDGGGRIGGAAISGKLAGTTAPSDYTNANTLGYNNPNSLDGSAIMARLVTEKDALKLTAGWSKISDDADLVAQWRYFPTWGYTRLMAQMDWIANTESYMARVDYNFGKAGLIPGMNATLAYEIIDIDDKKTNAGSTTWSDRDAITLDVTKTFKELPNTEFKFRMGMVDVSHVRPTADTDATRHADQTSYNEYRFEVNYLF